MSNRALIVGVGVLAERLCRYLEKENYKVVGFSVNRAYLPENDLLLGKNVFAIEDITSKFPPQPDIEIFNCIGYTKMNGVREEISKMLKTKGYKLGSYIHPSAHFWGDSFGDGTICLNDVIVDEGCVLGEGNILYPCAHISHDNMIGNYNFFAVSSVTCGFVKIENRCFIGANSTIKNDLTVKSGTLIGAGAYVSENTDEWSVIVPARSVKLSEKSSLDMRLV